MKKIIYGVLVLATLAFASTSCNKMLDVNPEGEISTGELYKTADGSLAAMNGIYRVLCSPGSTPSNQEQAFGIASNQLTSDLMGEDLVQRESGNGWFYYNYSYESRKYYQYNSFMSYEIWNQWYTVINQCNEILKYTPEAVGSQSLKDNVMAQAYAMRGFAYFNLVRWYQHTYIGNQDKKGVPIYTTPTDINRRGNPRATVEKVYEQINSDLDSAQILFVTAEPNRHKSHIDTYVTSGIQSRVAMVQERWDDVIAYADKAVQKPGAMLMDPTQLLQGFNNLSNSEWMWGAEISDAQASLGTFATLWAHMDARLPMHAQSSRKVVGKWLYDQIFLHDIRRQWFMDPATVEVEENLGPNVKYSQLKYQAPSTSSARGDYLYMRLAEMYINKAEALCRLSRYDEARQTLLSLISNRFSKNGISYEKILDGIPDGNELSPVSNHTPILANLMDEIMLQRRIELWGEGFRFFDIRRNKQGLFRAFPDTNHSYALTIPDPEHKVFLLTIPQVEFDSNDNMNDVDDQNPI